MEAKFRFIGYVINETNIKIVRPEEINKEIRIHFAASGVLNETECSFLLNMGMNISDINDSFNMIVNIQGKFEYDGDIESIEPYLINNAPAILFPYIRAYVASLSALSSIPCLLLPTLNMQGVSKDLKANITRE